MSALLSWLLHAHVNNFRNKTVSLLPFHASNLSPPAFFISSDIREQCSIKQEARSAGSLPLIMGMEPQLFYLCPDLLSAWRGIWEFQPGQACEYILFVPRLYEYTCISKTQAVQPP